MNVAIGRLRQLASAVAIASFALATSAASAQDAKPLKIGFIDDLNGPNSVASGPGSVEAAKMAIEDVGGKVLGRPIELLVATDENKPDLAVAVAKKWFEQDDVAMITGLPVSNSALAVQGLAEPANRIVIVSGGGASAMTGAQCSPNAAHWQTDSYAAAHALVDGVMQDRPKNWFFITVDYNFGKDTQADATKLIEEKGGKVLGGVLHPFNNLDFSSHVLAAQQSGADIIGIANGGQDQENTIKAAKEFGVLASGKQKLGVFFLQTPQIQSLGQKETLGLLSSAWYIPSLNQETKDWTARLEKRLGTGKVPTAIQYSAYSAVLHYLKAVEAAGTDDAKAVMAKMRELPINDPASKGGWLREDGRVMREMLLVEVKPESESTDKYDYFKVVAQIPAERAFRPAEQSECRLLKKN